MYTHINICICAHIIVYFSMLEKTIVNYSETLNHTNQQNRTTPNSAGHGA